MKFRFQSIINFITRPKKWLRFLSLTLAVFLATISLVVFANTGTAAAKKVVLYYGPQQLPLSVEELEEFADTGEASRTIRFLTSVAGQDRDAFRTVLTRTIPADPKILDNTLNYIVGELFLYEIGQAIHTPSRRKVIEALRSTLVLSAVDDGKLSLLEIIQKYPAQEIYVNSRKLFKAYGQVSFLVDGARKGAAFLQENLSEIIC